MAWKMMCERQIMSKSFGKFQYGHLAKTRGMVCSVITVGLSILQKGMLFPIFLYLYMFIIFLPPCVVEESCRYLAC